jgi:type IV secretory pathway TraG/TraD family ATPase VirD4
MLLAAFLLTPLALRRGLLHPRERHERGARLGRPRRWMRRAAATGSELRLAGMAVAPADECRHFKMVGTTGSGKSTAIRELIAGALGRGDRALISDPDGGYCARLYRPRRADAILHPFEHTALRWDPFAELGSDHDVELLASALIPTCEDPSTREWRAYARTLLVALVRRLHRERRGGLGRLWRLLTVAPCERLRPLLAGSPAQPFLDPDNARMFASIRSVLLSAVAPLEHIAAQRGAPFSVRQWVRAGHGVLFVPYRAAEIAALRSLIAAWVRLAIVEAMNAPEEQDQRLWFVVDELDALGAIDGLKDALARLRKFGGRCVLAFQSIAQVSGTYGAGEAQTIVENCGNTLILRCAGSENGGTSQFASRLIGEREVLRRQTTRGCERGAGLGARAGQRSLQVSEQRATEWALLPAEIEQLPDLCGYLKLCSSVRWQRVRLRR